MYILYGQEVVTLLTVMNPTFFSQGSGSSSAGKIVRIGPEIEMKKKYIYILGR